MSLDEALQVDLSTEPQKRHEALETMKDYIDTFAPKKTPVLREQGLKNEDSH